MRLHYSDITRLERYRLSVVQCPSLERGNPGNNAPLNGEHVRKRLSGRVLRQHKTVDEIGNKFMWRMLSVVKLSVPVIIVEKLFTELANTVNNLLIWTNLYINLC